MATRPDASPSPCFLYTQETSASSNETPPLDVKRVKIDSSVTEIAQEAFWQLNQLSTLQFPTDGLLQTIQKGAFMSCQALTNVVFPPSLQVIGKYAFLDCRNLISVQFPPKGRLEVIDEAAFCECVSLGAMEFPSTLSKIGKSAFYGCHNLVFPKLPERLTAIEVESFTSCNSLIHVVVPPHVETVGKAAFGYCSELVSITFPEGLKVIEETAFAGCYLLGTAAIPSTCTRIERAAFDGCDALVSVELPMGLSVIEEETFRSCRSLKTISIPCTVTVLQRCAFWNCECLKSIELPEGLQVIGETSFYGCESLINVAVPSTVFHMGTNAFQNCKLLLNAFSNDEDDLVDALMKRFQKLPVHKFCYYYLASQGQEEPTSTATLKHLENAIAEETDGKGGKDIFGMTPLHIMMLSARPNLAVCRRLLAEYPSNLTTRDTIGGNLPVDYACKRDAPVQIVELMVDTQRTRLPGFEMDWQELIDSTIASVSCDLLKLLVRYSIANRLQSLGLRQWKVDIGNAIQDIPEALNEPARKRQIDLVVSFLALYERKEILSLLEMALWKMKNDEWKLVISRHQDYELTGDDRQTCRINCGDVVIISNVLPFLGLRNQ